MSNVKLKNIKKNIILINVVVLDCFCGLFYFLKRGLWKSEIEYVWCCDIDIDNNLLIMYCLSEFSSLNRNFHFSKSDHYLTSLESRRKITWDSHHQR